MSPLPKTPETPKKEACCDESARDRIESAAVTLFCQKGYEATSVREIVEAAGVTKPVLYYYFKNKEDLFRQIIESAMGAFRQNFIAACSTPSGDLRDHLKAIISVYIDMARAMPNRVRFLHAIAFSGLYDDVFDFLAHWLEDLERVVEIFRNGQEREMIRGDVDPSVLARNYIGVCEAAMRGIAYTPELTEHTTSAEEIVDIIMKGIER